MFGNPETTTGGRALKFYSSVRADIRRIAAIKEGDVVVGNRTKVKIVKNKVAAPFREAEFDIIYGEGISREGDLIDLGVAQNIVEKSGSWYSYKGERIGQGRENARQFLKDNPDIRQNVDTELRKALGLVRKEPEAVAPQVPAPVEASQTARPPARSVTLTPVTLKRLCSSRSTFSLRRPCPSRACRIRIRSWPGSDTSWSSRLPARL